MCMCVNFFLLCLHPQHLCVRGSTEIVKRWVNETQEAVSSDSVMVQYHAMGLLYHIRKRDRLAVSKMVTKQIRSSLRSSHGYCLLIRIACKILENEERTSNSMLYDFLETCLRHKSEVGGCWTKVVHVYFIPVFHTEGGMPLGFFLPSISNLKPSLFELCWLFHTCTCMPCFIFPLQEHQIPPPI